jgi:uncharacterized protein YcgL (UPF0745 family)|tara:strand:- start:261 stop:596 length:336 start_codon:yes stop_codon:yes gene_type:complete
LAPDYSKASIAGGSGPVRAPDVKIICDIYKGDKKEEMYLYVSKQDALERVPEPLRKSFGELKLVTTIMLTPSRKLARADIEKVLADIVSNGFYLQMPPAKYPSSTIMPEYG